MILFVDIDCTVACAKARMRAAGQEPSRSDLRAYEKWLSKLQEDQNLLDDEIVPAVCELVRSMAEAGHTVIYLTGRSEQHRKVTANWLRANALPDARVIHRANDDWRTGGQFKIDHVLAVQKEYPGTSILMLDDDPDDSLRIELDKHGIALAKIYSHTKE